MQVKVENLTKEFGAIKAVDNVTLSIQDGKLSGLLGPSGCGKSTFLKTLNRMNDLVENVRITGDIMLEQENI